MTLDPDQIRDSIEAGIQRLVGSLDEQVRTLVDELWQATQQERERAVDTARAEAVAPPAPVAEHEAELARLQAALDARETELAQAREELAAAQSEPHEATTVAEISRRLVASVRRLDTARSLTEVLDTLADALRIEVPRSAIVVMKSAHAEPWRLSGFVTSAAAPIGLDSAMTGVFGRAATLGETSFDRADADADRPDTGLPFAELASGQRALAVPLVIGGRIAAVVYADDAGESDEGDPDGWPGIVEALARHAGRCLEALTAQRAQRTLAS